MEEITIGIGYALFTGVCIGFMAAAIITQIVNEPFRFIVFGGVFFGLGMIILRYQLEIEINKEV